MAAEEECVRPCWVHWPEKASGELEALVISGTSSIDQIYGYLCKINPDF